MEHDNGNMECGVTSRATLVCHYYSLKRSEVSRPLAPLAYPAPPVLPLSQPVENSVNDMNHTAHRLNNVGVKIPK